jgi:hypothetical protein
MVKDRENRVRADDEQEQGERVGKQGERVSQQGEGPIKWETTEISHLALLF